MEKKEGIVKEDEDLAKTVETMLQDMENKFNAMSKDVTDK